MKKISIAVVGSRDFPHLDWVREMIRDAKTFFAEKDVEPVIVSGGAKGVDAVAADEARLLGLEVIEFLPDWDTYGKAAGFIRNQRIIYTAEMVYAFWHQGSKGTEHDIQLALQHNRRLFVIHSDGTEMRYKMGKLETINGVPPDEHYAKIYGKPG